MYISKKIEKAFEISENLYQRAEVKREIWGKDSEEFQKARNDWSFSNEIFCELFGFSNTADFIEMQVEYMIEKNFGERWNERA